MASVNKAIILGRLGKDPETRYTPDGAAVTTISAATSRRYKDASGQMQEETEWHRVVFFGRLAEVAGEYLRKGNLMYVEGRLRTRKWTDKEGVDRYTTEIVAESLQLLAKNESPARPAEPEATNRPPEKPAEQQTMPGIAGLDDDIPF